MTVMTYDGDGAITSGALAELRSRIGKERATHPYNEEATRDTIRHFALGVGDDNPLYLDEQYARNTKYGTIVAPPCFLATCCSGGGGTASGLPGTVGLLSKMVWRWSRPVLLNDRIHGTVKLVAADEKPSRLAGRAIEQVLEYTFFNQRDELVANYWEHVRRFERPKARSAGKHSSYTPYKYSNEEMAAIEEQYAREPDFRRGATPRYWDDTNVGDELGPMVKGPLTITSMVTFCMGYGSPLLKTDRVAHAYMRGHPGARIVDVETNVPDFGEAMHWDERVARRSGMPTGFDLGTERMAWCGHLVTDWMGDDAFLRSLEVRLQSPNFLGDTTWLRGVVTEKSIENDRACVTCEMTGRDQRGQQHVSAQATVELLRK